MIVSPTKMQHFFARQRSDNLGQAAVLLYILSEQWHENLRETFTRRSSGKRPENFTQSQSAACVRSAGRMGWLFQES